LSEEDFEWLDTETKEDDSLEVKFSLEDEDKDKGLAGKSYAIFIIGVA